MNKKWEKYQTKLWDLGEVRPFINISDKSMSRIMKAIITCEAQIIDTFSFQKRNGLPEFLYPYRYCGVIFKIKLPIGAETIFEELSGFKLSEPVKVHLN